MKEQLFACFCICFSLAQTGHRVNVLQFPAVIVIFMVIGAVAYFTGGFGFLVWAIISVYVRVKFRYCLPSILSFLCLPSTNSRTVQKNLRHGQQLVFLFAL